MPVHSFETLAKMKAEIKLVAFVYSHCHADAHRALESVDMARYALEVQQKALSSAQLRAIGRLYRAFLSENNKELERMAQAYGQA